MKMYCPNRRLNVGIDKFLKSSVIAFDSLFHPGAARYEKLVLRKLVLGLVKRSVVSFWFPPAWNHTVAIRADLPSINQVSLFSEAEDQWVLVLPWGKVVVISSSFWLEPLAVVSRHS
jgi:hypothetical protein